MRYFVGIGKGCDVHFTDVVIGFDLSFRVGVGDNLVRVVHRGKSEQRFIRRFEGGYYAGMIPKRMISVEI